MRYELFIAVRYLFSRKTASEPSVIALITTVGIAFAVATLIGVLAVLGGFEGDLRKKMLNTRAHILITGPSHGEVEKPSMVRSSIEDLPHVLGVSPFIESELMISSPTKYSIAVYRGIHEADAKNVSTLEEDLIEGKVSWLDDSTKALDLRLDDVDTKTEAEDSGEEPSERAPTQGDLDRLEQDIANMQARIEAMKKKATKGGSSPTPTVNSRESEPKEKASHDAGSTESPLMPPLPPPKGDSGDSVAERSDDQESGGDLKEQGILMPSIPSPDEDAGQDEVEPLAETRSNATLDKHSRTLPGVILGRGLQRSLRVLVGDTVNLINPEGDLGPQGPIPRSRPHRVVGVFFSGLLQYDETVAIVEMETARDLLNTPGQRVTGIEVRVDDLHVADEVAEHMEEVLAAEGRSELEVHSWKELNRSLFDALALERLAITFGIGTIFIVSFLLVLLVLWMFVADKVREIALLKSIGATRGGVVRIFVLQGMLMGVVGGLVGLGIGMSFVWYATSVGIPLPADVYYIDRVPINLQVSEIAMVFGFAVVTSVAGSVFPALQAATLDPIDGLRRE